MNRHKCTVNLLNALKENIAVIISITLACGIVGFAFSAFVLEKRYVSEAVLYIEGSADEQQAAADMCRILSTSDYVLDRLSEELSVLGYRPEDYRKMISFSAGNDADMPKISVETAIGENSKQIAHELARITAEEYGRVAAIGYIDVYSESSYIYPNVTAFTLTGILIGFFVSYIAFLGLSLSDKRIKPDDKLAEKYGIPVYADIPDYLSAVGTSMRKGKSERLSAEASRKFIIDDDTASCITEAYKTAVVVLSAALSDCCPKIAVITSCEPAEGKSTVCLNLAVTMAKSGEKVLLIDGDMRKPVQHLLLNIDNDAGLSSILSGSTDSVSDVITENVKPCLDVISSGPLPENPGELLAGENMKKLLDIAGMGYDYIFIDSPPVMAVADAFLLNEKASGVIFVIKEGSTTHPKLEETLRHAKMTRSRILGFIKTNCSKNKKL